MRVTYVSQSGLQQVWDIQVDEPATSGRILAQLRAERPDVETIVGVERLAGANPPASPYAPASGNGMHETRSAPSRKTAISVFAVVVVAIIIAIVVVQFNKRDELSYQAGQNAGAQFANSFTALSSDTWSDTALRTDCGTLAGLGAWVGDVRVEGDNLDREDFIDGCYETARPVIPR